ncbi:MAG: DnaA/Hda family protein [Planctomycetia bacterium]|nr:DnaA/Hda family protein [Planctomycetia bacterium]
MPTPSASQLLNIRHRLLQIPNWLDEQNTEDPTKEQFSPETLLGGFLVPEENRLPELATRMAMDGVPVFDRPLGDYPLDKLFGEPTSHADVELLLRVSDRVSSNNLSLYTREDDPAPTTPHPLYNSAEFNARRPSKDWPKIVGYQPLEEVEYLQPLVFYGPSGSGKSRLIQGICQTRRLRRPQDVVYYVSAMDFANAILNALRKDQMQLFRSLFHQAKVVAIENAEYLVGRDTAQEEFLALLDSAIKAHALVILSFSKSPVKISGLNPDLSARLASGILAPTQLPSEATRRAIIDAVATRLALNLDEQTRAFCVARLPRSIGGVCASLVQIAQERALTRQKASLNFVRDLLERRNPSPTWSSQQIIRTTARYFGVSVTEMRGKKRLTSLVQARRIAIYLIRRLLGAPYAEIARQFSDREPATILHAERVVVKGIETDSRLQENIREIVAQLKAEDQIEIPQPPNV